MGTLIRGPNISTSLVVGERWQRVRMGLKELERFYRGLRVEIVGAYGGGM